MWKAAMDSRESVAASDVNKLLELSASASVNITRRSISDDHFNSWRSVHAEVKQSSR